MKTFKRENLWSSFNPLSLTAWWLICGNLTRLIRSLVCRLALPLGIVQGINLKPFFRDAGPANVELAYRYDNQATTGTDFDGDFHTVSATLYSPLPFWKLRADVGVAASYEGYDNANSLDADGDERNDWEFAVSAGVTKQIYESTALRIDYTYTDHNSNVETAVGQKPYEYDRHLFGVRLIFSY